MPQWAGSCWYYLRYLDPANTERFVSREAEQYWMGSAGSPGGVDLYVGGTEPRRAPPSLCPLLAQGTL